MRRGFEGSTVDQQVFTTRDSLELLYHHKIPSGYLTRAV